MADESLHAAIRRDLDRRAQADAIRDAVTAALRDADALPGDSRARLTARIYPREHRALNVFMDRTGLSLNDALRLSLWVLEQAADMAGEQWTESKVQELLLHADLEAYNDAPEEDRDPALLRLIRRRSDRIFRLGNPDADPDDLYVVTPADEC